MRQLIFRIKPLLVFLVLGLGLQPMRAEQPAQARLSSVSGNGIALLEVDYETGRVKSFKMLESTGNPTLDKAAAKAFAQHPFKPRTYRRPVRTPIAFTLTRRTVVSITSTINPRAAAGGGRDSEMTSISSAQTPRRPSAAGQKVASR